MTAGSSSLTVARIPHQVLNAVLVAILLLCMLGSYFGWGWALVAGAAALALTRPWIPTTPGRR